MKLLNFVFVFDLLRIDFNGLDKKEFTENLLDIESIIFNVVDCTNKFQLASN